jgi:hypothetical protein
MAGRLVAFALPLERAFGLAVFDFFAAGLAAARGGDAGASYPAGIP